MTQYTQRAAALHHTNVPTIDELMAYEDGDLDRDECLNLFDRLVKTGMAWKLQGHYGRTARRLLDAGLIDG